MNQQKKTVIADELRKVIPSNWKWRLGLSVKLTIRLTILSAPQDLFAEYQRTRATAGLPLDSTVGAGCFSLDVRWIKEQFTESRALFEQIVAAMETGAYDHSDSGSGARVLGHCIECIEIHVGVSSEKPFIGGAQWEAQELAKVVKKASRRKRAPVAAPAVAARRP